jgi:hypothetical protein
MTAIARRYLFDAGRGSVVIYFDAAVPRDFALVQSPDVVSAAEGDIQLF